MGMYSSVESQGYSTWSLDKLEEIREALVHSGKKINPQELELIDSLIGNSSLVSDITTDVPNFSTQYHDDMVALNFDYYDYIRLVGEYLDSNCTDITRTFQLYQYSLDRDLSIDILLDFFQELDSKWSNIFYNLYSSPDTCIAYTDNPSFSCYLNDSGIWIANIKQTGNVSEAADLAHEAGHGIQDVIQHKAGSYSPKNILLETFPLLCQTLFLDYLKRHNILTDQCIIHKKLTAQSIKSQASSLMVKYDLSTLYPTVSSAKNLHRILNREQHVDMSREDLEALYSIPAAHDINYVVPYIIMGKLYAMYSQDRDKFVYVVNGLMTSKDSGIDTIKKLELI